MVLLRADNKSKSNMNSIHIQNKNVITSVRTSTSNWNPCNDCTGEGCKKVPYGEVENSTSSSCPLEIASGTASPPPQNFRITGSLVV